MDVWLCAFTCIRDSIEIMLVGVLASLQAGECANKCCIYSFCDTEECILKHPSDRPPPQHTEVSLLSRPAGTLSPSQEHLGKPPDSSARYPVVPLLRRPSEGRTGGMKSEWQKFHRFDFSRRQVPFVTHKERRPPLVPVKGVLWGAYVAARTAQ